MTRTKVMIGGALTLTFSLLMGGVASAGLLSKAEWRAQAGEICTLSDAAVGALANAHFGDLGPEEQPTDDQLRAFADAVIPVIDQTMQDVVALEEPAAFKKNVKKWAKAVRGVSTAIDEDPSVLNSPDPFDKPGKVAKKLGLKGCN